MPSQRGRLLKLGFCPPCEVKRNLSEQLELAIENPLRAYKLSVPDSKSLGDEFFPERNSGPAMTAQISAVRLAVARIGKKDGCRGRLAADASSRPFEFTHVARASDMLPNFECFRRDRGGCICRTRLL